MRSKAKPPRARYRRKPRPFLDLDPLETADDWQDREEPINGGGEDVDAR